MTDAVRKRKLVHEAGYHSQLLVRPDGKWVHIDDYTAMKDERDALREAAIEAHALLVYQYQSYMKPPSQTDGRYEESMFVWNLDPMARDMMTGCEQELFDALMKARAAIAKTGDAIEEGK